MLKIVEHQIYQVLNDCLHSKHPLPKKVINQCWMITTTKEVNEVIAISKLISKI